MLAAMVAKNENTMNSSSVALPAICTGTLSTLLMMTTGDYRSSYLFGDILIMMCACVIGRPRLPNAMITVALQCLAYHGALFISNIVSLKSTVVSSLYCISGGVICLISLYAMEAMSRNAFLLNLRVMLLNRQLETWRRRIPSRAWATAGRSRTRRGPSGKGRSSRPSTASIILIDIDRFKSFNDSYGHSAGDLCLQSIARHVRAATRAEIDVVVRFGGEELLIFLPETDFTDARRMAERIRVATSRPPSRIRRSRRRRRHGEPRRRDGADERLFAHGVDDPRRQALYAAKHAGRNQIWPPLSQLSPRSDQSYREPDRPSGKVVGAA